MRNKKGLTLVILGILLLSLIGCSSIYPTPEPTSTPIPSTPTITATPEPKPEITVVEPGQSWNVYVPDDEKQLIVLNINCGSADGCLDWQKIESQTAESYSIQVKAAGEVIWQYACDQQRPCEKMASPFEVAFYVEKQGNYSVALYGDWAQPDIQVHAEEMPALMRGIAYSPFRDCQSPSLDIFPSEDEIVQDLRQLKPVGNAIRTYSSQGVIGEIPRLAVEQGFQVSAGAWLGKDLAENEREINALIEIAKNVKLESVIVGNEVLLRGDLSEGQLIGYIQRVKNAVDVPVTTAEIAGILTQHPLVMDAVDYQLIHIYAYWDGQPIDTAAYYVANVYKDVQAVSNGKRVVIGETGWPSDGPEHGASVPSLENQQKFLRDFIAVADAEGIEYYYFSVFDEMWKSEGGVGQFWGYVYADRTYKYPVQSLMLAQSLPPDPGELSVKPIPTATVTGGEGEAGSETQIFYVYKDFAYESNHFSPSGWMGDYGQISVDTCSSAYSPPADGFGAETEPWPNKATSISYFPTFYDENEWAGVYWLEPKENWGKIDQGYDLTGYKMVTFRAKSACAPSYRAMVCSAISPVMAKFFVGGVSENVAYPSSITNPIYPQEANDLGFVTLTDTWQEFHVDLTGADLSHVFDGFGVAFERVYVPYGVTIDIDDIQFTSDEPPVYAGPEPTPIPDELSIYTSPYLSPGFDLGVDSSSQKRDWLETTEEGYMIASYPRYQSWGVVYITYGPIEASRRKRAGIDLSMYTTLSVEMRSDQPGQTIEIGVKDKSQADNGREDKVTVELTDQWQTYEIPVYYFNVDWTQIYIPVEFVFSAPTEQTVYIRNIKYQR